MSYIAAFADYLQTGDSNAISNYIADGYSSELLKVFRNGFYKACFDALTANYPATRQILGEDKFNYFARQYIEQHPPAGGSLVGYGHRFCELLEQAKDANLVSEEAIDIASLDFHWITCLNGAQADSTLYAEQVPALNEAYGDIGSLPMHLADNVFLLSLRDNAFAYWRETKAEGTKPVLQDQDNTIQLLLWRFQGQVQARVLDNSEACFFKLLKQGGSLNEILESTLQQHPDFNIEENFSACLHQGLIALVVHA